MCSLTTHKSYLSSNVIGLHVREVPHSMRPSGGYRTDTASQKGRTARKFVGDKVFRKGVACLGDFMQIAQQGLFESEKSKGSRGLYVPRVYLMYG